MDDQVTINIKFSITMSKSAFARMGKQARSEGYGYSDAGPVKTVSRYLTDNGIQGAFTGEEQLDIIIEQP